MTKREAEQYNWVSNTLSSLGFSYEEIEKLFRIERTLQRWGARECGDSSGCYIERDEETGKPYLVNSNSGNRRPTADREKGALTKLEEIMKQHPTLNAYHQGDPRGCALYILRPGDVPAGEHANAYYSRGIAVCY
jgi:hypothetical protein